MNNQLNNLDNFNSNYNNIGTNNNVPFIQKIVFFLVGLSTSMFSLAIWFLLENEKKYNYKLKYMKYGAITGIVVLFLSFILGFIFGFIGAFI